MTASKLIYLSDEAYEIWKNRFGNYSQKFSRWVCDKLLELEGELTPEEKQRRLEQQQKELLEKIEKSKKEIERNKLRLAEKEEQERITKKRLLELNKKEEINIIEGMDVFYKNIKFFFPEIPDDKIKELAEDYALNENPKEKTLFEYLEEKGYKTK